ncbi:hypothetical protein D1007_16933 [Hordeum vulgare]|nr:hypothetical protein D1007_16933 [Hordeum vulgare]
MSPKARQCSSRVECVACCGGGLAEPSDPIPGVDGIVLPGSSLDRIVFLISMLGSSLYVLETCVYLLVFLGSFCKMHCHAALTSCGVGSFWTLLLLKKILVGAAIADSCKKRCTYHLVIICLCEH